MADPDRGFDAIVIGEYERAFYGGQYAAMAPLFEHYGIQLWTPESSGPIDFQADEHEQMMLALGWQSKHKITRTRMRSRTAMAAQTREQGRYLGGRPPYGYRLADAGPHPNKAHAVPWACRPQAAALLAALADPDRGFDAIVVGEYERAFYGPQYAAIAPLFEHYGVQLWMPEVGGRVNFAAEGDEQLMFALGLQSKREITRTRIRVRTAMAAQARDQGRYLGGRPPYGYRLADVGPHPNKAHAAWGRRAHRLEPDPDTAPVVRWMFAQRLAGHSPRARGRRGWGSLS